MKTKVGRDPLAPTSFYSSVSVIVIFKKKFIANPVEACSSSPPEGCIHYRFGGRRMEATVSYIKCIEYHSYSSLSVRFHQVRAKVHSQLFSSHLLASSFRRFSFPFEISSFALFVCFLISSCFCSSLILSLETSFTIIHDRVCHTNGYDSCTLRL